MEMSSNAWLLKGLYLCEKGKDNFIILCLSIMIIIHGTQRDKHWRYSVANTQSADHPLPAVASKMPHKNHKLLSGFVIKTSNRNSEVTVLARGKYKFLWCRWEICGKGSGWTLLGQLNTTKGHFPPYSKAPVPHTNRWPAAQTRPQGEESAHYSNRLLHPQTGI